MANKQLEAFLERLPEATRAAIGTRLEIGVSYEVIVRVASCRAGWLDGGTALLGGGHDG